jgi:hypothetical protein
MQNYSTQYFKKRLRNKCGFISKSFLFYLKQTRLLLCTSNITVNCSKKNSTGLCVSLVKHRWKAQRESLNGGYLKIRTDLPVFLFTKTQICDKQAYLQTNASKQMDSHMNYRLWNNSFDKNRLKTFVSWFLKTYGEKKTIELLEELKNLGFGYATQAGVSLGIDDLLVPNEKMEFLYSSNKTVFRNNLKYKNAKITAVEKVQLFIDTWNETSENLKKEVIKNFEKTNIFNPVYMMAFSGARGNISQVRQLVGMRGLMSDPQGNIIDFPIQSNFKEGLTLTEYIISTYGARKGIVDTALRTATAGYLTRRLVDVAQHVMISLFDCKTNRGIFLFDMKEGSQILYSFQNRLIGRVLANDIKIVNTETSNFTLIGSRNQEISIPLANKIADITKKAFVRSPLTCQSSKFICQLCYGWSLSSNKLVSLGEAVGVIAAQSIGEPGTQLTMRTFHTGGVFSGGLTESVIANYDGWIEYLEPISGTCIRTLQGKIAFLTKTPSSFVLKKALDLQDDYAQVKGTEVSFHKIPGYAVLFARNKQQIFKKQIIAQFSSDSQNIGNLKTQKGNAEQVVYSDLEGEIFFNQMDLLEQKSNYFLEDTLWKSNSKSKLWILSGKVYQNFLGNFDKFLVRNKDFVNKNSVFERFSWYNCDNSSMEYEFQIYPKRDLNKFSQRYFKNKYFLKQIIQTYSDFIPGQSQETKIKEKHRFAISSKRLDQTYKKYHFRSARLSSNSLKPKTQKYKNFSPYNFMQKGSNKVSFCKNFSIRASQLNQSFRLKKSLLKFQKEKSHTVSLKTLKPFFSNITFNKKKLKFAKHFKIKVNKKNRFFNLKVKKTAIRQQNLKKSNLFYNAAKLNFSKKYFFNFSNQIKVNSNGFKNMWLNYCSKFIIIRDSKIFLNSNIITRLQTPIPYIYQYNINFRSIFKRKYNRMDFSSYQVTKKLVKKFKNLKQKDFKLVSNFKIQKKFIPNFFKKTFLKYSTQKTFVCISKKLFVHKTDFIKINKTKHPSFSVSLKSCVYQDKHRLSKTQRVFKLSSVFVNKNTRLLQHCRQDSWNSIKSSLTNDKNTLKLFKFSSVLTNPKYSEFLKSKKILKHIYIYEKNYFKANLKTISSSNFKQLNEESIIFIENFTNGTRKTVPEDVRFIPLSDLTENEKKSMQMNSFLKNSANGVNNRRSNKLNDYSFNFKHKQKNSFNYISSSLWLTKLHHSQRNNALHLLYSFDKKSIVYSTKADSARTKKQKPKKFLELINSKTAQKLQKKEFNLKNSNELFFKTPILFLPLSKIRFNSLSYILDLKKYSIKSNASTIQNDKILAFFPLNFSKNLKKTNQKMQSTENIKPNSSPILQWFPSNFKVNSGLFILSNTSKKYNLKNDFWIQKRRNSFFTNKNHKTEKLFLLNSKQIFSQKITFKYSKNQPKFLKFLNFCFFPSISYRPRENKKYAKNLKRNRLYIVKKETLLNTKNLNIKNFTLKKLSVFPETFHWIAQENFQFSSISQNLKKNFISDFGLSGWPDYSTDFFPFKVCKETNISKNNINLGFYLVNRQGKKKLVNKKVSGLINFSKKSSPYLNLSHTVNKQTALISNKKDLSIKHQNNLLKISLKKFNKNVLANSNISKKTEVRTSTVSNNFLLNFELNNLLIKNLIKKLANKTSFTKTENSPNRKTNISKREFVIDKKTKQIFLAQMLKHSKFFTYIAYQNKRSTYNLKENFKTKDFHFSSEKWNITAKPGWVYIFTKKNNLKENNKLFNLHQVFIDSGKNWIHDIIFQQNSVYVEACCQKTSCFLSKLQANLKVLKNKKSRYIVKHTEKHESGLLIRPIKSKILPNSLTYKNFIYKSNTSSTKINFSHTVMKSYHSNLLNKQRNFRKPFFSKNSFHFKISKASALKTFQQRILWFYSQKNVFKKSTQKPAIRKKLVKSFIKNHIIVSSLVKPFNKTTLNLFNKNNFLKNSQTYYTYKKFFCASFYLKFSPNKNFYLNFPKSFIQINSVQTNFNSKANFYNTNSDQNTLNPQSFYLKSLQFLWQKNYNLKETERMKKRQNFCFFSETANTLNKGKHIGPQKIFDNSCLISKRFSNDRFQGLSVVEIIQKLCSSPYLKWFQLKKTAYLGNQKLPLNKPSNILKKKNFQSKNSFLLFEFNSVLKNQVFANTDILSPFEGELVEPCFAEKSWWKDSRNGLLMNKNQKLNHKIFLTKKDIFSVFIPNYDYFCSYMAKQKKSSARTSQLTTKLKNNCKVTKIKQLKLKFNTNYNSKNLAILTLILKEDSQLMFSLVSSSKFVDEMLFNLSFKQKNYALSLKKIFLKYLIKQNNKKVSNLIHKGFKIQRFFTTYKKQLYKLKGLEIGKPNKLRKLSLGNFLFKGDLLNPSTSFNKTGQILHFNQNRITLRNAQCFLVSPKGILHVHQADFIFKNVPIITLPFDTFTTGDIVQGIPKVEQYLEARTSQNGRPFLYSLPILLQGIFKRYSTKLPLEEAVSQSFLKIQLIIVDGVQRVYRSQGVSIADKHLEVIVKQMTSKVQILHGGQTGFFPGELVDREVIERINPFLMIKIQYEPVVLGITRASLEVESFLSAASFQQTTKILAKASLYKKKDFLKGLKENILIGNLIPAGTGYMKAL